MNYEQFKNIPIPVAHNLKAVLDNKAAYGMEFTEFEKTLVNHFNTLSEEIQIGRQKSFLEHCFTK